ncbi:MAG: hypothetical protein QM483_07100 [Desulfuromusa sp.]
MQRQARIDIPGLLQHVIVRGVSRLPIFYDDYDREDFLGRFNRLLQETTTTCYAWVLLDNHFYLLLQPQGAKPALLMRRLLTGYAVAFNLRHKRAGYLFQNRYMKQEAASQFNQTTTNRFLNRTQHFTDRGIIGSREFVRRLWQVLRSEDDNPDKQPVRISGFEGVFSLRRLSDKNIYV